MKIKHAVVLPLLAGGLAMVSGCVVRPDGSVAFQPVVIAPAPVVAVDAAPPPPPEVTVDVVPETYVWDGYENVGIVGGQYYYLGPGSVWVVCDPVRVERFNGWIGVHPDWRGHLIVNDRYRNDAHGNFHAVDQRARETQIRDVNRITDTQLRRENQINDTQQRRENQINDTQQRRENQINDTQQRREDQLGDTQQKRENQISDTQQRRENTQQKKQAKQKDKNQDSGH